MEDTHHSVAGAINSRNPFAAYVEPQQVGYTSASVLLLNVCVNCVGCG